MRVNSNRSRCSCGEEILWVSMSSGAKHPCNPDEIYWDEFEPGQKIVMCTDEFIRGTVEYITQRGIDTHAYDGAHGYESHFSTCPDADKWRNK